MARIEEIAREFLLMVNMEMELAGNGEVAAALTAGMNGHLARAMSAEALYRAVDACLHGAPGAGQAGGAAS
ncbi:hypothetical protein [uncultured Desulfovibrio sp.]|uniref:hypothetical protein n=1 Tax=uncultured Desulfovibrio sp. TaxID=167968 RepID=UPI002805F02B|nr:hypothetical protein [uncultured Desulfovibrio sp.]